MYLYSITRRSQSFHTVSITFFQNNLKKKKLFLYEDKETGVA